MINVNKEIISFKDIPAITHKSERSVLLVRHSFRESLQNGNHDPGLTREGWDYAEKCGELLYGIEDVCFGASSRNRTVQTIQAIIKGGKYDENSSIVPCPLLHDTAMFSPPEKLAECLNNNTVPQLLKEYFTTGKAPGMIGLNDFSRQLAGFLTGTVFEKSNVILSTHDIVLIALLSSLKVYPFCQDDWCGYVQGAFFNKDATGDWTISYAVPNKEKREACRLFI